MKILIAGHSRNLIQSIAAVLSDKFDVIYAGEDFGSYHIDLNCEAEVSNMFEDIGQLDGIIHVTDLIEKYATCNIPSADAASKIAHDLKAPINLLNCGKKYLKDKGVFIFTNCSLTSHSPRFPWLIPAISHAIATLGKAEALKYSGRFRLNTVSHCMIQTVPPGPKQSSSPTTLSQSALSYFDALSPNFVRDFLEQKNWLPMQEISVEDASHVYRAALEWDITGQTLQSYDFVKTPWTKDDLFS